MECQTASTGNLFVVRWRAFTAHACDHVVAEIAKMHKLSGARIPYLGIMPEDMARIDDAGRKALAVLMAGIEEHCELAAVAVETRGFAGAAYRSLLAGLMLVSRRKHIKFVDTVDAAVRALQPMGLPENKAVREAIAAVGGSWTGA